MLYTFSVYKKYLLILALAVGFIPYQVHALLPPDLVVSVGSQIVQFFSIGAVVVGGVFSSLAYWSRRWFCWSNKKVWKVISLIVFIVVCAIVLVYVVELEKQNNNSLNQMEKLQSINAGLEERLGNSVSLADYQRLVAELNKQSPDFRPDIFLFATGTQSLDKQFHSDNIILYRGGGSSFALEIDFNRIEVSPGVYTHYTYLNGNINGEIISDYDSVFATTTTLQKNRYVTEISRVMADDLSPRDSYKVTVLVNGDPVSFEIKNLQGDFVTRNHPDYTQLQSEGTAEVIYKGEKFEAQALVENTYANNYTTKIFFPGYQEIDSTTHQFVLWDENENFYLIDISEVRSDTPEYPSHVWLLYKSASGETIKKSFSASVSSVSDKIGRVSWSVSAPDFEGAMITVSPVVPFKQSGEDRIRTEVSGTIYDNNGSRSIGGILHLVK